MADYDLVIIGGGINGTAIARDAAGRGVRVLLAEQHDLASGTSSTSTKLIHGGLRYLEQGAFRLVQEGLHERTTLLRTAPHIVWPARFVLPHHKALRPAWQLRLGLFLYDLLSGKSLLPRASTLDLSQDVSGPPLQPHFHTAFEYSDCCVDDARLVVLNAVDAAERGATIHTRTRFTHAERRDGLWHITLESTDGQTIISAKALINATGPWIDEANSFLPASTEKAHVRLVKGSHIVVPRLFAHEKAYIFQNADGRIVFAIPYQQAFTLIGTTEEDFTGDPARAAASDDETSYLCRLASSYFRQGITPDDVIWSFAGIRALYDSRSLNAKDLSRDYLLALDTENGKAPLLSIYGGKLTAARHLAEKALEKLRPYLSLRAGWTAQSPLPGGDFAWHRLEELVQATHAQWRFLDAAHIRRMVQAYGTRVNRILENVRRPDDMGAYFGDNLTEREIDYLIKHEWATSAEDILWRRSKLGLFLDQAEQEKLAHYLKAKQA